MTRSTILRAGATVKQKANALMRSSSDPEPSLLPYFCECDDPDCLRAVWLSPREYDRRKAAQSAPLLADAHRSPLARTG